MFRAIAYMIAAVIFLTILRAVVGVMSRFFAGLFMPSQQPPSPRRGPTVPAAEILHKDPVCGAFVAPSAAVRKTAGGKEYYFCSTACRDKFSA